MTKLYVRAICPNDIEEWKLVSRDWGENYAPWYIGHEKESELVDEKLDEMFDDWIGTFDPDDDNGMGLPPREEAQFEFEDFTDFLGEHGYHTFYTGASSIWMPLKKDEDA